MGRKGRQKPATKSTLSTTRTVPRNAGGGQGGGAGDELAARLAAIDARITATRATKVVPGDDQVVRTNPRSVRTAHAEQHADVDLDARVDARLEQRDRIARNAGTCGLCGTDADRRDQRDGPGLVCDRCVTRIDDSGAEQFWWNALCHRVGLRHGFAVDTGCFDDRAVGVALWDDGLAGWRLDQLDIEAVRRWLITNVEWCQTQRPWTATAWFDEGVDDLAWDATPDATAIATETILDTTSPMTSRSYGHAYSVDGPVVTRQKGPSPSERRAAYLADVEQRQRESRARKQAAEVMLLRRQLADAEERLASVP